ncbi:MAG TPA: hypothetical protein VMB50_20750 [Myxococcales bacterium]|nr:hypothetical protein [Myxococcales bacterium]
MAKRTAAPAIKRKRRPRGRPFEKGNKIGPRFEPGISGNPDGRPRDLEGHREECRRITDQVGRAALEQMASGKMKADRGRIAAIQLAMEHGYGRAKQPVEHSGGDKPIGIEVRPVNEVVEELRKMAETIPQKDDP